MKLLENKSKKKILNKLKYITTEHFDLIHTSLIYSIFILLYNYHKITLFIFYYSFNLYEFKNSIYKMILLNWFIYVMALLMIPPLTYLIKSIYL
jgi:hypothetical protein